MLKLLILLLMFQSEPAKRDTFLSDKHGERYKISPPGKFDPYPAWEVYDYWGSNHVLARVESQVPGAYEDAVKILHRLNEIEDDKIIKSFEDAVKRREGKR